VEKYGERILGRLGIGDGAGVKYLTSEYLNHLYGNDSNPNKIKNLLFELLIRARDLTNSLSNTLQKSSYTNEAFDSIFSSDNSFFTLNEKLSLFFITYSIFFLASLWKTDDL
jgi:hypothetical protein